MAKLGTMHVVEKKQIVRTQKYLVSMSAKELRLLTFFLSAAINEIGLNRVPAELPLTSNTVVTLERQLERALAAETSSPVATVG